MVRMPQPEKSSGASRRSATRQDSGRAYLAPDSAEDGDGASEHDQSGPGSDAERRFSPWASLDCQRHREAEYSTEVAHYSVERGEAAVAEPDILVVTFPTTMRRVHVHSRRRSHRVS